MITDKEKIQKYEEFLHMLQLYSEVCVNQQYVSKLISNACDWSYSYRIGNSVYSDEEHKSIIDESFSRLTDI